MRGSAIAAAMSHRVLLSLIALVGLAMVALSLVWPQGLGRQSPDPFGHPVAPPPSAARSAK